MVITHRILLGLVLATGAMAQAPGPAAGPPGAQGRASSAVVAALDVNGDRQIDANELEQAAKSLARLDRNHDGQLTRDEYRVVPGSPPAPAAPPPPSPPLPAGKHPNILVIVADDLGWNGVGFHDPSAPTPNLNRLATEGLELQRFYTYPVCSPTRAAFLTGQMPRRFGIVDALGPRQAGLPPQAATLPEQLRAAGYRTALVGKWHLGAGRLPGQCGFDHFYGHLGPQIDYFNHTDHRGEPDWQRDGKPLVEAGYSTDLLADEAIRQLKQRDPGRPFFLEVAFNAPHIPLAAPAALVAKHQNAGGLYAAVIEALDLAIGRILATVDELELRQNTLVVFFSDNGAGSRFSSNAPLSGGKDSLMEGGIRTPCIMRWPGQLPAGAKSGQPVCVQDLFPTFAAAAGVTVTNATALDGSSQWPALLAGKAIDRAPFLIATRDFALIDGDWKLLEWENGRRSLCNLQSDIAESKDLATARPEVAERLAATLAELKKGLPSAPVRRAQRGRPSGPAIPAP
jgi:arylsulfatase A-like enzyme